MDFVHRLQKRNVRLDQSPSNNMHFQPPRFTSMKEDVDGNDLYFDHEEINNAVTGDNIKSEKENATTKNLIENTGLISESSEIHHFQIIERAENKQAITQSFIDDNNLNHTFIIPDEKSNSKVKMLNEVVYESGVEEKKSIKEIALTEGNPPLLPAKIESDDRQSPELQNISQKKIIEENIEKNNTSLAKNVVQVKKENPFREFTPNLNLPKSPQKKQSRVKPQVTIGHLSVEVVSPPVKTLESPRSVNNKPKKTQRPSGKKTIVAKARFGLGQL